MPRHRTKKPPICDTKGRRLLLRILSTRSQQSVAEALSTPRKQIKQQSVSQWAKGQARPEPHCRAAMARQFGIPTDSWFTSGELAIARGTGTDG